jgi:hypothetical protein
MDKLALQLEISIATGKMMELVMKHLQISVKEMDNALKSYQNYQETTELTTIMYDSSSVTMTTVTDEERASISKIYLTIIHMFEYGDDEIITMAVSLLESLWQLVRMYDPIQKIKCPETIETEFKKLPLNERYAQEVLSLESLKNTLYN